MCEVLKKIDWDNPTNTPMGMIVETDKRVCKLGVKVY